MQKLFDADKLEEVYDSLWSIVEDKDEYQLSSLEADIVRLAASVLHQMYLVAEFSTTTKKLSTGGIEHLYETTKA